LELKAPDSAHQQSFCPRPSKNVKRKEAMKYHKGCEEKHSNTTAHHPVVKPSAAASTAVSHTPTDTTGLGKLPETIL